MPHPMPWFSYENSSGQKYVYQTENKTMVFTYWQIGKRIYETGAEGRRESGIWKKLFKKKFAIFSESLFCISR